MENPLWNLEEGIYTEVMGKWNEIGTNGKLEWNYFILLGCATDSFLKSIGLATHNDYKTF